MAKKKKTVTYPLQIGPRLSREAIDLLGALQEHYAKRAGLLRPLSQSEALEIILRDVAKREGAKA